MDVFRKVFYACSFILLFVSCSKDEIKTEGEIMGEQIQQVINDYNVSMVRTYVRNYGSSGYSLANGETSSYIIEGQIVKVGLTYYNLNDLLMYEVNTGDNSVKILSLYFN